jgi:hypothetical protein
MLIFSRTQYNGLRVKFLSLEFSMFEYQDNMLRRRRHNGEQEQIADHPIPAKTESAIFTCFKIAIRY